MFRSLFHITPSGATGLAFAAFVILVLPFLVGSLWLSVFTSTAIFALAVSGVAFMYSWLGMVSLTQVSLMGLGGWVMLRLHFAFGLPFEINMMLAGLATMLCGMILALPAIRLRGLYLALVTLMVAGGLEIIFATYQFPNGGTGFWAVQTSIEKMPRPFLAQSDAAYLRYTVIIAVMGFLLIELLRRMAPGRAWALIRRSEAAAMAAGVNVVLHKTIAFALSGFIAGLAGALLAGSLGLLDSGTFRAGESILVFALAVVGGARYWLGVVIAAALFRILPALLNNWGLDADLSFVVFGAGLLHAIITAPDGIAGQIRGIIGKRFGRAEIPPVSLSLSGADSHKTVSRSDSSSGAAVKGVSVRGVSVNFGGVVALDAVDAEFTAPISGIIGPNGAGKTTLMNVFSGYVRPSVGAVSVDDQSLFDLSPHRRGQWGLRRSFQEEEIADDLTVAENVLVQLDSLGISISDKRAEVMRALDFVGMTEKADVLCARLNSFERRLTDVAKCIAGKPKLIMFDEPAGGLSQPETELLGNLILDIHRVTGTQTIVIDHDVDLIARICSETLVLDFGKKIAFGPTADVLADPKVKAAYLGV